MMSGALAHSLPPAGLPFCQHYYIFSSYFGAMETSVMISYISFYKNNISVSKVSHYYLLYTQNQKIEEKLVH